MPAHKSGDNTISHDVDDDGDDNESLKRRRVISTTKQQQQEEDDGEETDQAAEAQQQQDDDDDDEGEDSDWSGSSDNLHNSPQWVTVDLSTIRVNVQCPICLGIIKNTRTMMDCLHRFCRKCIEQSMRLGNNECPACRKHCASRRALRDDPRFDAFIESLFDDVEKFEKEEMASDEEAKIRNKQIQDSIAKISQKQTEALAKKRKKLGKGTHSVSEARVLRKYHAYTRRNGKRNETEESEENEDGPNRNKELSSGDERRPETKKRRYKKKTITQPSPSAANSDSEGIENELIESNKEIKSTRCGPMRTPEMFSWGGAGARSRCSRKTRLSKLTKYLENKKENYLEQLDVNCMLISSDEQRIPSLQQLFLSCPPRFTVEHLKQYVASEIQLLDNDVDILLVKTSPHINDLEPSLDFSTSVMQILEGQKTIAEIRRESASNEDHLILAYRLKRENSEDLIMKRAVGFYPDDAPGVEENIV